MIDYVAGGRIASRGSENRQRWLRFSIVSDLSILGFFKYFDLGAETVNGWRDGWGRKADWSRAASGAAVGISFTPSGDELFDRTFIGATPSGAELR